MTKSNNINMRLSEAAFLMDFILEQLTGLNKLDRKVVVYYTLGTYSLSHVGTFPLLVLKGPMGTGKSTTLRVIAAFANQPLKFSLRGMTLPTIRDKLADCLDGTAIIEEADQAWKDSEAFEAMLSDRYQRESALAALKEKAGDTYETTEKQYFGATVLHRRVPFGDAALDGRSIIIYFRSNPHRSYDQFRPDDPLVMEGQRFLRELSFEPPQVASLPGVAPRIFDTYEALLGVAALIGDDDFSAAIRERLLLATAALGEAQADEPHVLVLKALIECMATPGGKLELRNVRFRDLAELIWHN